MTSVTDTARGMRPPSIDRAPGMLASGRDPHAVAGSPLTRYLRRVHDTHRLVPDGTVATYIPELGLADPAWFGIAAATLEGTVHEVGDTRIPFTIQSISKPLTYALALDELGEKAVRARIGVEPTGDAFNSITLDRATGRPLNPMINAGAIAAAGLIVGTDAATPIERVVETYGRFAGRVLDVDRAVEESERSTGHRNRAIGHLLRASGALDGDADAVVERYFAQCAVAVTAADLAIIAATLANGGVNPVTGVRVASAGTVRSVLAVMATCGMYDGAGEWLYAVGLPAKSGVSGGVLVVVPGRLGLGFFSPPLDPQGNSVRSGRACRDIVNDLDLHPLGASGPAASPIRTSYNVGEVSSKRQRSSPTRAVLSQHGGRSRVIELQGVVTFLAADAVDLALREAAAVAGPLESIVLDFRRVERLDPPAAALLADVVSSAQRDGVHVDISGDRTKTSVVTLLHALSVVGAAAAVGTFPELDAAVEAAEERLLARLDGPGDDAIRPDRHPLLAQLDEAERSVLLEAGGVARYEAGSRIVRAGDPSEELFLVLDGRLSVTIETAAAPRRRLSTLGPGMAFGETALCGAGRRGADVDADSPVTCFVLTRTAFEAMARDHPAAAVAIMRSLLGTAIATTGRLTREFSALAG